MKRIRWVFFFAAWPVLISSLYSIERLPIEDFAKEPEVSRMRLSPDGRQVAYAAEHLGVRKLHVLDLESKKLVRINIGQENLFQGAKREVGTFVWANNKRLFLTTVADDGFYGTLLIGNDGKKVTPVTGWENLEKTTVRVGAGTSSRTPISRANEVIFISPTEPGYLLLLDRTTERVHARSEFPDIVKVDANTGDYSMVEKNPGQISRWGLDFHGVARLGILAKGTHTGAVYRSSRQEPWKTVLELKDRKSDVQPVGYDAGLDRMVVAALTKERRWAPFVWDATSEELGEPIISDPLYDVLPTKFTPSIDGVALSGPIFSHAKKSLIGIKFYTDAARVRWLDKEFAGYQRAVDKFQPDTVNLLVDQSADGKRLLWFSYSDQNPGSYSVLDVEKRAFNVIGARMSWIKVANMAQTLAVKYTARDGLLIHGYLTVPTGHAPNNLPVIVMPHGGPWVRDVWGFDPLVQLLANRGYAVLQMNYRGSIGYGEDLYQSARRQIGGEIQDDIEDATRWAIAAGVADPKRVAIYRMSYGGYSALFALGKSPGLYRCGISFAGVTDWYAMYKQSDAADYKVSLAYWREQIGDPSKDADKLQAISPVYFADKITAPTLIIQGKEDRRVPLIQARSMVVALEKAGQKPETLYISGVGHNYGDERQQAEIFRTIVAFLEKNLGPGVL